MKEIQNAIQRLSDYGLTFNLEGFLKAHLEDWDSSLQIGMEVLYFNRKQMLLEQIAHVGFSTPRHALNRPVRTDAFERQGICSYAVLSKESVLVPNVAFDIRYLPVQEPDTTQSELAVPLKLGEEVLGVLNLESERPCAFSNRHVEYFQQISPLLAIMIEYRTYRVEEKFFEEALSALSALPDRRSIYQGLLPLIINFLGGDCVGCILTHSDNGKRKLLRVAASQGLGLQSDQEIRSRQIPAVRKSSDDPSGQYVGPAVGMHVSLGPTVHEIRSEYVLAMDSFGKTQAFLYIGSPLPVFAERNGYAIRRLCRHVSALLEGLDKRAEREKQAATKEALTLVDRELHNQASLLSLALTRINQKVAVPADLMKLFRGVEEALSDIFKLVQGFQSEPDKTNLLFVLEIAEHYAHDLGIRLHREGSFDATVLCSKVGLRWIIENLILNSAHHATKGGAVEVWLENVLDGNSGTLRYWDNGRMDGEPAEALKRLSEGAAGRKGIKIIRALCEQFKWEADATLTPAGAPLYTFSYNLR